MYKYNQVTTEVKNRKYLLPILGAVVSIVAFAALSAKAAPAPKVNVCHKDDKGYHMINISSNALKAHINHGDGQPDSEVGDVAFATDCTAEKFVEIVTVDSAKIDGADSTSTLLANHNYIFKVSGTWNNRVWEFVDAKYTSDITWDTPSDAPAGGYGPQLLDLQVDGQFVDWGDYSSSHEYSLESNGTDDKVNFRIFDGDVDTNTQIPEWFSDNIGSLEVKVYEKL